MTEVTLHDAAATSEREPFPGLTCRLLIEETQPDAAAGLGLTVLLANEGRNEIEVFDPLETTHTRIQTPEGWPVEPLLTPGPTRINRHGPGPATPEVIRLEPGAEHRMTISVKRIPARQNYIPVEATGTADTVPLPPGAYDVSVRVTVIAANATEQGVPSPARSFESPRIRIRFGHQSR